MLVRSRLFGLLISAAFGSWLFLLPTGTASADDNLTKTERAEAARKSAQERAKARLGRPDVEGPTSTIIFQNDHLDYLALREQIARLAAAVRAMDQSANVVPSAVPNPTGTAATPVTLQSIYGPDGPTAKSVGLILEYRLMVVGNPRLKVGDVVEDNAVVTAHVVTVDGSLVDKFKINKKTGAWTTVR